MKNIVSIIGARPQFVKAAPVSRKLREKFTEILVHTGQHYDTNMSDVFFKELGIPEPDYNLGVGSGPHGEQTGKMLIEIEKVLVKEKPNLVLVYGDTNSTIAGSLAAAKLHIKVAHVEAGLRSFNREMPEELNRVVTDHLSDLLFCPTGSAVENLKKEGIVEGVFNTGDVMYDAVLSNSKILTSGRREEVLKTYQLKPKTYLYATVHRPVNTDNPQNLKNIFEALAESGETVVLPIHPRTRKAISDQQLSVVNYPAIKLIDPVGYRENLILMENAKKVLTDSGGIQKEAYFLKVPCITMRDETEWVETVEDGWNILTGADKNKILKAVK
ncbi:MAG: UDP-N-acetylglucosamine 2-epimerase (non-hydrolyzing), partial [Candidatus Levyibacteriota bacterium]